MNTLSDLSQLRRIAFFLLAVLLCLSWISTQGEALPSDGDMFVADAGSRADQTPGSSPHFSFHAALLDESVIGLTDNMERVEEILEEALRFRRITSGYEVSLQESLTFEPFRSNNPPQLTPIEELRARIEEQGTFVTHAIGIIVGGEQVGTVRDLSSAEALLEQIKEDHRVMREEDEGVVVESVHILEDISFVSCPVEPCDIKCSDAMGQVLLRGTDKVVEHKVESGDTAWGIAQTAGMSVHDLERANPGSRDLARLQPGDRINMVVADPHITLRTEERHRYTRPIPFAVETREDSDAYPWERTVIQAGRQGAISVEARVIHEDGEELEREILAEERISDPVTHIVSHGTKTVPQHGSGQFIVPAQGRLTSGFGPRRGGFHSGIDLAMPVGTPIRAADGGMVTSAGWQGAYGRVVFIDHGGGEKVTVYAHLSRFNVSVGDVVAQGDVIGYSGNSGRSTGPHLHFEIRVNGTPRNPINYFPN